MSDEEFKNMNSQKKVEFINANIKAGMSFKDIYDATMHNHELVKSRETLINQFKKAGYLINSETLEQRNTKDAQGSFDSYDKYKTLQNDHDKLETILKASEEIMQMLDWWKVNNSRLSLINNKLMVDIPNGDEYRKTIRINAQIWDQWKVFCGKHPDFSEKDLLAKALLFYMNS
jgi:hypothetical protein